MDDQRRELHSGWVSVTGGLIEEVGIGGHHQRRQRSMRRVVWSPLVSLTHHHLYQNLTGRIQR